MLSPSQFFCILCFLMWFVLLANCNSKVLILASLIAPLTGGNSTSGSSESSATRFAVAYVNKNSYSFIDQKLLTQPSSTNYTLVFSAHDTQSTENGALNAAEKAVIDSAFIITSSSESETLAILPIIFSGNRYQVSYCTSNQITNAQNPYLSRVVPADKNQGTAMADLLHYFGWAFTVGSISTSDVYGSGILAAFLKQMTATNATVLASQQFYPSDEQLWSVLKVIKESTARAIVSFMDSSDFHLVMRFAERMNMTSEKYVWLCSDACTTSDYLYRQTAVSVAQSILDEANFGRMRGMMGLRLPGGNGEMYNEFLDMWSGLDPIEYPGAGARAASFYAPYAYDAILAGASALGLAIANNVVVTSESIVMSLSNFSFQGLTGNVSFDSTGTQRLPEYAIVNLRQTSEPSRPFDFVAIGNWSKLDASKKQGVITFDYNPHFFFFK